MPGSMEGSTGLLSWEIETRQLTNLRSSGMRERAKRVRKVQEALLVTGDDEHEEVNDDDKKHFKWTKSRGPRDLLKASALHFSSNSLQILSNLPVFSFNYRQAAINTYPVLLPWSQEAMKLPTYRTTSSKLMTAAETAYHPSPLTIISAHLDQESATKSFY
ncbi:hypothetical protein BDQ12DRAFT_668497 [Crucibulum laeve]|uniref:Uncharacterized protein n=1 Tax=Crucibulum laeve TaxID=68775 RepID=A0A5C3LRL5_9AGAR|nr:hypothetical protein BDQ12DRAFT_668497 [Crucibulum laeve]